MDSRYILWIASAISFLFFTSQIQAQAAAETFYNIPIDANNSIWEEKGTVNLGPKAGNIVDPIHIALDSNKRAFVSGLGGIAIIDLELGQVTNVLDLAQRRQRYLALMNQDANELYILAGQGFLEIWDLNLLTLKKNVPQPSSWSFTGSRLPGSMILSKKRNQLYVASKSSFHIIDLNTYREIKHLTVDLPSFDEVNTIDGFGDDEYSQISYNSADGIIAIEIDEDQDELYILNHLRRSIQVMDLETQEFVDEVILDQWPVGDLLKDPERPYLYFIVKPSIGSDNQYNNKTLYRMDLSNRTSELILQANLLRPRMALDNVNRELWVSGSSELYKINISDFSSVHQTGFSFSALFDLAFDSSTNKLLGISGGSIFYSFSEGLIDQIAVNIVPKGIAVSHLFNQAFISRGELGGWLVANSVGEIIRTIIPASAGISVDVWVDDFFDRLYLIEQNRFLVYELSTLRQLHEWSYVIGNKDLIIDHNQAVVFATVDGRLKKLNALNGDIVEVADQLGFIKDIAIDWKDRVLYGLFLGFSKGKSSIWKVDVDTFAILPHDIKINDINVYFRLAFDQKNRHLFIFGMDSVNSNGLWELRVWDVESKEVVLQDSDPWQSPRDIILDIERDVGYLNDGRTIKLSTLEFNPDFSEQISQGSGGNYALNHLTNTFYIAGLLPPGFLELRSSGIDVAGRIHPPGQLTALAGDKEAILSWEPVSVDGFIGSHK